MLIIFSGLVFSVAGIGPVLAFLMSGALNKLPLHLKGNLSTVLYFEKVTKNTGEMLFLLKLLVLHAKIIKQLHKNQSPLLISSNKPVLVFTMKIMDHGCSRIMLNFILQILV